MDVEVSFEPQGAVVRVPAGTTLLEAARKAQLPLASGCGGDTLCARCGLRVLGGAEHLSAETEWEVRVKRRNALDPALRLACCTTVSGPVVVSATYW
jgi:ferredoxin